jgi:hypothetical protein
LSVSSPAISVTLGNGACVPENIDGGLRALVSNGVTARALTPQPALGLANKAIFDSQGRVARSFI